MRLRKHGKKALLLKHLSSWTGYICFLEYNYHDSLQARPIRHGTMPHAVDIISPINTLDCVETWNRLKNPGSVA